MSTDLDTAAEDGAAATESEPDTEALLARLETLEEDNERLRRELSAARRTSYRRTALGMAFLGGLSLLGAGLLPGVRSLLIALGGTGLFGAVLTYYLTPERFVAASVGEAVYTALATNLEGVAGELELSDSMVYLPVDGDPAVRLYLPERPYEVGDAPDADQLRNTIVVGGGHRGLSLRPSGDALRKELAEVAGPLSDEPGELVATVAEALVEQFELAEIADPDVDGGGRATLRVEESAYGPVDRLDHPVASLLAVTLADALGVAVELEVAGVEGETGYLVTCRWEPSNVSEAGS